MAKQIIGTKQANNISVNESETTVYAGAGNDTITQYNTEPVGCECGIFSRCTIGEQQNTIVADRGIPCKTFFD